jgi:hypothetical protein
VLAQSEDGCAKASVSMHAGVTAATPVQLDFSRADEKSYAEAMKLFSRFVWLARRSCVSFSSKNVVFMSG